MPLRQDDPLAGYSPDWRNRRAQTPAVSSTVVDDPLAGYTPDWRNRPLASPEPVEARTRGAAPTGGHRGRVQPRVDVAPPAPRPSLNRTLERQALELMGLEGRRTAQLGTTQQIPEPVETAGPMEDPLARHLEAPFAVEPPRRQPDTSELSRTLLEDGPRLSMGARRPGAEIGAPRDLVQPRSTVQKLVDLPEVANVGLGRGVQTAGKLAGETLEQFGGDKIGPTVADLARDVGQVVAGRSQTAELPPTPSPREDPLGFVVGTVAQTAPIMAPMLASGAAGGAAAVALQGPSAIARGQQIGTLAASYLLGVGDARQQAEEAGWKPSFGRDVAMVTVAIPYAALDAVLPQRILARFGTKADQQRAKGVIRDMLETATLEGGTEGAQSFLTQLAAGIGTGRPIDPTQIGAEALAGAVAGGVMGGAANVFAPGPAAPPPRPAAAPLPADAGNLARAVEAANARLRAEAPQQASVAREPAPALAEPAVPAPGGESLLERVRAVVAQPEPTPAAPPSSLAPPESPVGAGPVAAPAPVEPVAPPPTAPAAETKQAAIWVNPTTDVDIEAERFQYKESGPGGVTGALSGVQEWNDDLAGIVALWRDPADGRLKVVNGHQRVNKARELGRQQIRAMTIDAPTAEAARAQGALMNIASGSGTAVDASKIMRELGWTREDMAAQGVPMKQAIAADGLALAQLHDGLFALVAQGREPVARMAVIGRSGLRPEQQLALYEMVKRQSRMSPAEIEELARFVKTAESETVSQETLFGTETFDESLAVEKARLSAWAREQLGKQARLFQFVSRGERAQALEQAGVGTINTEAAGELGQEAAAVSQVYQTLSTRAGPVSDALNRAVRAIRDGGDKNGIRKQLLENIRGAVQQELGQAGIGQDAGGAVPGSEPARAGVAGEPSRPAAAAVAREPAGEPAEEVGPTDEELEAAGQSGLFGDYHDGPDLFGEPVEMAAPKVAQGNLLSGLAAPQGMTPEQTRAFRGEKLRPEEIVGRSEATTPEGPRPLDAFEEPVEEPALARVDVAPIVERLTRDIENAASPVREGREPTVTPRSSTARAAIRALGEREPQLVARLQEELAQSDEAFLTMPKSEVEAVIKALQEPVAEEAEAAAAQPVGPFTLEWSTRADGRQDEQFATLDEAIAARDELDGDEDFATIYDAEENEVNVDAVAAPAGAAPEYRGLASDIEQMRREAAEGASTTIIDRVRAVKAEAPRQEGLFEEQPEDLPLFNTREPAGLADVPSVGDEAAPFEQEVAEIPGKAARTLKPVSTVELVRMVGSLIGKDKVFLKNFPQARGMFYADPKDPRIGLHPALGKDYQQFARTLAHEIGHMVDFLSDKNIDKGNILGRIASLPGYMRSTIDALPTDPSKALTKQDRAALRKRAEKQVGAKPGKKAEKAEQEAWARQVTAAYGQIVRDEMDARNLLGRERVHEELRLLSEWWRPWDRASASSGFIKYRDSSVELYADALSVLLNSPGSLQERAPTFFEAWLSYLEKKPDVQAAYNEIQDVLGQGPEVLYEQRKADIQEDFAEGERKRQASENAEPVQGFMGYLKQTFVDRAAPVIDAESRRLEDAPAASDSRTVKMAMQEHNHADNVNRLMLMDINRDVHRPMGEAGLAPGAVTTEQDSGDPKNWSPAGQYMFMTRIAEGDRGGLAEDAKEVIKDLTGEESWEAAKAAYIKLGEQDNDEGDSFDPALLAQAEGGILNPKGYTPATAKEHLTGMKNELGDEYAVLEESIHNLRDMAFKIAEEAVRVGSYNQDTFKAKIVPNRDTYAPFAVVDYFNGRMPAGVERQIGTVKGIADPYTALILKMMSLNRLNEHQKAKQAVLAVLDSDFPGQGKEQSVDKYNREKRPGPGKGNLTYLVDGKLKYREVDDFIAKVFESSDLGQLERITKTLGSNVYGIFHPLYVSWSVAWQARNIVRDWKRTYKNLAAAHAGEPTYRQAIEAVAGITNLSSAYLKSLGVAKANASREDNAVIRDMLNDRALGRAFHSFDANPDANTNDRLLQRYGITDPAHPGLKGALEKAGSPIEWLGVFQETLSKAAAYKVLGDMGVTGRQRAYMVRNYSGTPDSQVRGLASDMVNAIYMYSNVIMAGWRSDAEVALSPDTAPGYWMRSLIVDFMPKMMMASAVAGWLGDDLKEWFSRIPSYDLEKYIIVPLGEMDTPNGEKKSVYLRLPHDDTNRVLASATWALMMGNRPYAPSHAMGIIQGEFPGVNPALDLPIKWAQMLGGRNPYDTFRQRDVIPSTEWTAGGWPRAQEMLKYSLGQFGVVSQVMPLVPGVNEFMRPDTTAPEDRVPGENMMRSIPGIATLIGVTDRGLDEQRYWEIDAEQQLRAQIRTEFSAPVRAALRERARLNSFGVTNLTDAENVRRRQLNTWYSRDYTRLTADMVDARDRDDDAAYEQANGALTTTLSQPSRPATRPRRPARPQRPQAPRP